MSEISISDKLAETYLVSQEKLKRKKTLLWFIFILALLGLGVTGFVVFYKNTLDRQAIELRIIEQLQLDETSFTRARLERALEKLNDIKLDNSIINGIINFLLRIPVLVPFFWVAWFCQRSISQIDRLSEEYRHKESAMRTYEGFMQQIQALHEAPTGKSKKANRDNWTSELEKDLMNVLLNVIEKNPSDTLGKPITPIDKVVELLESWKKDRVPKEKSKTLKRKSEPSKSK